DGTDTCDDGETNTECETETTIGDANDPGPGPNAVSVTQTRTYDHDGRLVEVTFDDGISTETTGFSWDSNRSIPQIITWTDTNNTNLIYGNTRLAATGGVDDEVFAYNPLGDAVAQPGSAFGASDRYGPYGEPSPPGTGMGFGYRGELHVSEDLHLRARDLTVGLVRFNSVDPVDGASGTSFETNHYHYAGGDPTNFRDPLGRSRTGDESLKLDEGDLPWGTPLLFKPPAAPRPTLRPIPLKTLGRVLGRFGSAVVGAVLLDIVFADPAGDPLADRAAGVIYEFFPQTTAHTETAPERRVGAHFKTSLGCGLEARSAYLAARQLSVASYVRLTPMNLANPDQKFVGERRTLALGIYCIDDKLSSIVEVSGKTPALPGTVLSSNIPLTFVANFVGTNPDAQHDAEIKLSNRLVGDVPLIPLLSQGLLGVIVDSPTEAVCPSCWGVFRLFSAGYPLIDTEVYEQRSGREYSSPLYR
ncbi:MAG: hypothetical protein GY701_13390, partial [Sulfitobacter sp.]|nr:hypothetical protein [Sulfitobacter sp.]